MPELIEITEVEKPEACQEEEKGDEIKVSDEEIEIIKKAPEVDKLYLPTRSRGDSD
jgi:hypothetical protein